MKKILICASLSVALLSGCSILPQKNGIIRVNNDVITKAEFDNVSLPLRHPEILPEKRRHFLEWF